MKKSSINKSNIQKKLDGILHLTLDLEALEYVSSAGLRAVLSLDKLEPLRALSDRPVVFDAVYESLDDEYRDARRLEGF